MAQNDQLKISLRPAEPKDMRQIFKLSNEPAVRHSSFHQEKISYQNHKKWYDNKITDHNVVFLVAEINHTFAGQVRFEITVSEALISLSVSKNFRGQGVGSFLIQNGLYHLKQTRPEVVRVLAYVKDDNHASIRLFIRNDFKPQRRILVAGQPSFEYCYIYNPITKEKKWT